MLEVDDVQFTYPPAGEESPATVRASFTVAGGGTAALMGASGAGKTTLLNLIAGFLPPGHGDIRWRRRSLLKSKPADRPLTYLLQAHNLFPHLTVQQNLAIGLHPGMRLTKTQTAAIAQALKWVDLTDLAHRRPGSLSGGQQQRTALARCFARCTVGDRPLLLLDEPFTALDDALRTEMLSRIAKLQKEFRLTILIATHQKQDAEALAAEVVVV